MQSLFMDDRSCAHSLPGIRPAVGCPDSRSINTTGKSDSDTTKVTLDLQVASAGSVSYLYLCSLLIFSSTSASKC